MQAASTIPAAHANAASAQLCADALAPHARVAQRSTRWWQDHPRLVSCRHGS